MMKLWSIGVLSYIIIVGEIGAMLCMIREKKITMLNEIGTNKAEANSGHISNSYRFIEAHKIDNIEANTD